MLKKLFFVAMFLLPLEVYAQEAAEIHAPIAQEDRIFNHTNVNCVFCSVEMMARRAKETRLYGISSQYIGPCSMQQLINLLIGRNIRFKISHHGSISESAKRDFLLLPCKYEKRGVVVGVDNRTHVVNLVHYDDITKTVMIIENGDKDLKVQQMDWDEFHRRWDGYAIIIYAKNDPFPIYK